MEKEYIGMRFAVLSGGSHKVVVPKEIVDEIWRKVTQTFIPVCFLRSNSSIVLEDIENILGNSSYKNEIISQARRDWEEYAWKLEMKKEKMLHMQYISGDIDETYYRLQLVKYREAYHKISKKIRDYLVARGLHFAGLEDSSDVHEMELLISESEKDEKCSEIIEEIKVMMSEKIQLKSLLERLETRIQEKRIDPKTAEQLKLRLERELMFSARRLELLKEIVNKP